MRFSLPYTQRTKLYHLGGWAIFILYEVSFVTIIRWASSEVSFWSGYFIPYLVNIALFYCHALLVLPFAFNRQQSKAAFLVGLVLLEIAIYLLLMGIKDLPQKQEATTVFFNLYSTRIGFVQQLWRGIYFLIFSTAYWLIYRSFIKAQKLKESETRELLRQQENQALEFKLVSTQNAYLQSQINPHLLFNTLNFIHSEVQQISPTASDAIITLSDMMRYSLAENNTDGKAKLENEIEQVENLIRINQFRFNNKLSIEFTTDGKFDDVCIIPLLLVPIVENIFKYGELIDPNDPATIRIMLKENTLYLFTHNKKRKVAYFPSSGIGLKNVETRLTTYYPDSFLLQINDTDSTYSIELSIKL